MGSKVTIGTPRASSGFTHELAYRFAGGSWTSIATGVATSYEWTVPDLSTSVPNATSGTVTIRCITKSGSTTVGTKTVLLTAKVPTSVVPTISGVVVVETVSGLASQFGAFIQGKSKIKATISAAGAKGSTIKSYSSTFAGTTYTGSSWTTGAVSKSGTLAIVTTVTDSRGRTAKKTTNVTVVAYSKPTITRFQVLRANANGTANQKGIYLLLNYAYSVPSLNGGNTAAVSVRYKKSTETTWSSSIFTSSALSGSAATVVSSPTFSLDNSYDVEMTVKDWFGATSTYTAPLPSEAVIADIKANGKGVGVGAVAEQDGITLGWAIVGQGLSNVSTYDGVYETQDGLLIQWGRQTIVPTAANTATTVAKTFKKAYTGTPVVLTTPVSTVPNQVRASPANINSTGFDLVLVRENTTSTGVQWIAIGAKA